MKVRIKKTGQILNVEYDDDDLYKGWDGSGPVWFTFNEFDFIDEDETSSQTLFTLTPEEVDVAEVVFNRFILDRDDLRKFITDFPKEFEIINNVIIRIKHWQDENRTNS